MTIKPGMLCLVTAGRNAGRECTVVRWVVEGEEAYNCDSLVNAWLVHGPNIMMGKGSGDEDWEDGYGLVYHQWLLPIGGRSSDELAKDRELTIV